MKVIDRTLSKGDVVEIGTVEDSHVETARGGGVRFIAAHSGETEPYVVLKSHAEDGTEIDMPSEAEVLAVSEGSGMAAPSVWLIVPREAYA